MKIKRFMNESRKAYIGHYCPKCGEKHRWPGYVFGHYDEEIRHICECGQMVLINRGTVIRKEDQR